MCFEANLKEKAKLIHKKREKERGRKEEREVGNTGREAGKKGREGGKTGRKGGKEGRNIMDFDVQQTCPRIT